MTRPETFIPRTDRNLPFISKVAFYFRLLMDNTHGPAEAIRNPHQEEKPKEEVVILSTKKAELSLHLSHSNLTIRFSIDKLVIFCYLLTS